MTVRHEVMLDFARKARIGFEEAILCQGKTTEHLVEILSTAKSRGASLLLTRLSPEAHAALPLEFRDGLDYEPLSRTAFLGRTTPVSGPSQIAILAAGTSDAHVTREIQRVLAYSGVPSTLFADVGVAGLWRLLDKLEAIAAHRIAIVVAGMDAALPTVVGGLFGGVIIGVPTSTGYGVSTAGQTALHSMLASCAPGVMVMNIDNGYGAACAAMRVLHTFQPR
jgi:NCAIR mutase (PurE)-related protein